MSLPRLFAYGLGASRGDGNASWGGPPMLPPPTEVPPGAPYSKRCQGAHTLSRSTLSVKRIGSPAEAYLEVNHGLHCPFMHDSRSSHSLSLSPTQAAPSRFRS
ncbi:hypothetical protein EMWEY_00009660 [Eimeria maxima]|uniref:Uncharacterized protein n=1 Tax=Eimeria maxima TaxID=5804 RepID=U6MDY6_EIMMA|nr:hypothetical protein EMWEY_00009660 [Eimeria maxima]CDJ61268.1 hypothetical protein EMWEY_00009660 [Eimeria maxima]